jgi:hypothetical protein
VVLVPAAVVAGGVLPMAVLSRTAPTGPFVVVAALVQVAAITGAVSGRPCGRRAASPRAAGAPAVARDDRPGDAC